MQQPVRAGTDERVTHGVSAAVEGERHPPVGPAIVLPPADVRDVLVRVLVSQVVEVVVGHLDREPVLAAVRWQTARHRPGTKDTVLLEPEVEVWTRPSVIVQDEGRLRVPVVVAASSHMVEDDMRTPRTSAA